MEGLVLYNMGANHTVYRRLLLPCLGLKPTEQVFGKERSQELERDDNGDLKRDMQVTESTLVSHSPAGEADAGL